MAVIARSAEADEIYERGNKAYIANDYAKAIAEFSKLLELLPNDDDSFIRYERTFTKGDVYRYRGACYGKLEQPEKEIADLDKAISVDPKNGTHYYMRSLFYLEDGEMEKAKADIEKAVELHPEDAGTSYNTFANYIRNLTGDKRTAAVYYKKSVEHGDDCGMSKSQLDKWGM